MITQYCTSLRPVYRFFVAFVFVLSHLLSCSRSMLALVSPTYLRYGSAYHSIMAPVGRHSLPSSFRGGVCCRFAAGARLRLGVGAVWVSSRMSRIVSRIESRLRRQPVQRKLFSRSVRRTDRENRPANNQSPTTEPKCQIGTSHERTKARCRIESTVGYARPRHITT